MGSVRPQGQGPKKPGRVIIISLTGTPSPLKWTSFIYDPTNNNHVKLNVLLGYILNKMNPGHQP